MKNYLNKLRRQVQWLGLTAMIVVAAFGGVRAMEGTVSMDMRNTSILDVIQLLANSAQLNIVIPDELEGQVTVKLSDVYWEDALDSILKTKGYSYQKQGDVIRIDAMEDLKTDLETRVFILKHVDATDIQPFLASILSQKGKINSFTEKGRSAFAFGTGVAGEKTIKESETAKKSRILSITDVQEVLATAEEIINQLDIEPQQISIQAQVVEVILSKDQQIGIQWNTVASASGGGQPWTFPFPGALGGPFTPTGTAFPTPGASTFTFGTLDASNMTATLRLLEEKGKVNVLSSPKITTLNNLEAKILIGERFPITTESIDAQTGLRTITLDHYEDIGIQLIVIPQVSGNDAINMIIHPAISSLGELVDDRYPRINTREADTQILIRNNHTVVIGGLLEDRDTKTISQVPVLGDIPILKYLFRHKANNVQKVELLIFVTPQIVYGASEGLNREVKVNQVALDIMEDVDKQLGVKKKAAVEKEAIGKASAKGRANKHSRSQ